ncbi:hypothetical protein TNCV_1078511 [Trichonephila clavipes]|nr:hypothetical protein TNCV_1078511 [Trichonephila clavipes]
MWPLTEVTQPIMEVSCYKSVEMAVSTVDAAFCVLEFNKIEFTTAVQQLFDPDSEKNIQLENLSNYRRKHFKLWDVCAKEKS